MTAPLLRAPRWYTLAQGQEAFDALPKTHSAIFLDLEALQRDARSHRNAHYRKHRSYIYEVRPHGSQFYGPGRLSIPTEMETTNQEHPLDRVQDRHESQASGHRPT